MLLEVTAEADRWEQTWCSGLERGVPAGILAIGLCANRRTRKIMLVLADGPLSVREVRTRLPELRRSTLQRRLQNLVLGGLLERQQLGRVTRYELTARARHLALVAMLAGRWECRWSRPDHAVPASDLSDLLHILAPIARIEGATAGICQLHLEADGVAIPDIYLAARAGSILALPQAPATPPQAVGHATPEAWFDTLLRRDGQIAVTGNQALLSAVLAALNAVLAG